MIHHWGEKGHWVCKTWTMRMNGKWRGEENEQKKVTTKGRKSEERRKQEGKWQLFNHRSQLTLFPFSL